MTYLPGYSVPEWQEMRSNSLTYLQEAVTTVTPFAGLTSNALSHLQSDWIEWQEDHVVITIPAESSCTTYTIQGSHPQRKEPGSIVQRDKPCKKCRQFGDTNRFQNRWNKTSETEISSYSVVLNRELAKPAVDFLDMVFNTYDRPEIAADPAGLHRAARSVQPTKYEYDAYRMMLRTGPVIYRHYGLEPEKIAKVSPYSVASIEDIINGTPLVNMNRIGTPTFLRTVDRCDPATSQAVADELNMSRNGVAYRLGRLADEGRVTRENSGRGLPKVVWKTTKSWKEPFKCDECDFTSHSLMGMSVHQTSMHDKE